MDWNRGSQCIMNVGVNGVCSNLGYVEDGVYIASDDCEDYLIELLRNLQVENPLQRQYRRQLCFSRVVELDIVPLIKYIKDQSDVFSATIRFLTTFIQPVECLTLGIPSDVHLPWLMEIKTMLQNTRRICTDKEFINAIGDEMSIILDDHDGEPMSEENCDFLNKCLLLFRNLLYIQDNGDMDKEEVLILYLFECNIGRVINRLVTIPQREYWSASIIQLVSLIYTRRTLEILNQCLCQEDMSDNFSAEGSDDWDCYTVRHMNFYEDIDQDHDENSSSNSLTGMFGKSLHVVDFEPGFSDKDQSQSNEEDMLVGEEQENKRIETFRCLLLEFTSDFINKGFGNIVHDLKNVLISDMDDCLDDTYFLWAMAFFLRIARRENVSFKVIRPVLTTDLFGFLAYEGVVLSEQLLIAKTKKHDCTNGNKRLHMTVSCLSELLKTLTQYSSNELEMYDREYLIGLQKDLANLTDLRMVFILLIRNYPLEDISQSYLEDLITTNHKYLELLDSWDKNGWVTRHFDMLEHIKLFGTRKIMQYYGTLLANFESNSTHVNKCVFTMMHHVAGECCKIDVLYQVPIIQSLMEVDGSKNYVSKEMNDLTEYVINAFTDIAKNDPVSAASHLYGLVEKETKSSDSNSINKSRKKSTDSDSLEMDDMLFTLYNELQKDEEMVDKMADSFADLGITVSTKEIWTRLYDNGLITDSEYLSNKKLLGSEKEREINNEEKDIIRWCVGALKEKHQEENLKWIQTLLCETAYVKLGKQCDSDMYEEPVTMYHVIRGSSVPLVLYKEEQDALLHDQHFKILLHYLGFHTPQDVDMIYPRIPSFWTSEQLLKQAEKLGPISKDLLKFDPETAKFEDEHNPFPVLQRDKKSKDLPIIPEGRPSVKNGDNNIFWLKQIQQYNMAQRMSTTMSVDK